MTENKEHYGVCYVEHDGSALRLLSIKGRSTEQGFPSVSSLHKPQSPS